MDRSIKEFVVMQFNRMTAKEKLDFIGEIALGVHNVVRPANPPEQENHPKPKKPTNQKFVSPKNFKVGNKKFENVNQAAQHFGIDYSTITYHLKRGKSIEEACTVRSKTAKRRKKTKR